MDIKNFLSLGIQKNDVPEDIKITQRSNFLALFVLGILFPFVYIFYRLALTSQVITLVLIALSCLLVFWLNGRRYFKMARYLQIFLLGFWLFYYSIVLGYTTGAHYLFFVSLLMPFALLKKSQFIPAIIVSAVYFILFLIAEFQWLEMERILDNRSELILRKSVLILVFIWLFVSFMMFTYTNHQTERRLTSFADRLKFRNKETEQIVFVTSHDLQEPLNSIRQFIEYIENEEKDKLSTVSLEYFSFIRDGINRMHHLVLNLMNYSRIGANSKKQKVKCSSLVKNAIKNCENFINETEAVINYSSLPTITVYPDEIQRMFYNLIENSLKFRNPEIKPVIDITANRKLDFWEFKISDNGIGIEERFYDKIFSIFKKLHPHGQYDGVGIGLAECRKIVELHGGQIWVNSQYKCGTTFYFTIPIHTTETENT